MKKFASAIFSNLGGRTLKRLLVQDLHKTKWFSEVYNLIQAEMERQSSSQADGRPALEQEASNLGAQMNGWTKSLANPNLSQDLRATIEEYFEKALHRAKEIDSQLAQLDNEVQRAKLSVDPALVVDRLNQLAEVMLGNNPSRTNIELGLHIEKISCHVDGSVTVRTCKLGALAECVPFIPRTEGKPKEEPVPDEKIIPCVPRKRGLRRLGDGPGDRRDLMDAAHHSSDVKRFEGLGPEWFWEDNFPPEPKNHWFQENGAAVAAKRAETGWSFERLAKHFGKSIPTLRRAMKFAESQSLQIEGGNSIAS